MTAGNDRSVSAADVVVVSYNTRALLRGCLESVREAGAARILVVDNGSTDGSQDMVREDFPDVQLLECPDNPGYGAAANRGVRCGDSPLVLVLNADTEVLPGAMRELVRYLDEHPAVGLVGPRLENPDGSLQPSRFPELTPLPTLVLNTYALDVVRLIPPLGRRYRAVWVETPAGPADWVKGAAVAIRREAFEELDGFDPSFFMYAEDLDLCLRMRRRGWEVHYVPSARVVHVEGASTRQHAYEMDVRFFVSLEHFYRLHYGAVRLWALRAVVSLIMLQRLLRAGVSYLRRSDPAHREALREKMGRWWGILVRQWVTRTVLRGGA